MVNTDEMLCCLGGENSKRDNEDQGRYLLLSQRLVDGQVAEIVFVDSHTPDKIISFIPASGYIAHLEQRLT